MKGGKGDPASCYTMCASYPDFAECYRNCMMD